MTVYRCFVEKKPPFAVEAEGVLRNLQTVIRNGDVRGVRILNRYDLESIEEADYRQAERTILSEPQVDVLYEETAPEPAADEWVLAVEYLPGQFEADRKYVLPGFITSRAVFLKKTEKKSVRP